MSAPAYDDGNVFARILRGEMPAHKVYEDEHAIAIMDVMPQADGHTLVIPKAKSRNLLDIGAHDLTHLMAAVQTIAPRGEEGVRRAGRAGHAVQRGGGRADGIPHACARHPALRGHAAEAAFGQDGGRKVLADNAFKIKAALGGAA